MAENRLYNIIALLIAIFTYLFLIFLFIEYVKEHEKRVKDYGYNVEDAIVVELDTHEDKKPNQTKPKPKPQPIVKPVPIEQPPQKPQIQNQVKPEPIAQKEVKSEEESQEQKEESKPQPIVEDKAEKAQEARDIESRSAKDLFSTIRTDKYEKAMEEKQKEEVARASRLAKQKAKRAKEAAERKRKKALEAAKALLTTISSASPSKHKKRGESDDFWSPVSSRIMAKWQRTISTQNNLSAVVRIRIDSNGLLTYKVLRYSNNPLFDKKLDIFLQNLQYETFPRPKGVPYKQAKFEFKDKEQ